MAEEIILKVGVEGTGEGETKIKSLKAQLKEMKNELLGLDEGSDRFKQLSKDAGELQDRIGDVNDKVKALASDTKRLDALVGVGSAIAGGFQAAQGAMALFGSDSKKVEEAIKNIIAVQGILNGVQQVGQFITAKGIVQDALYATGRAALAAVTRTWVAIQWALNAAMTANPIGLIIAGVAALTTGIVLLAKNFKSVVTWITDLENLRTAFLLLIGPIGWLILAYDKLFGKEAQLADAREKEEARRQKAREKEAEDHKDRLEEIEKEKNARIAAADKYINALELEKETLEAQGKSSDEVTMKILEAEKEKTVAVLEANKAKIDSWIKYYTNLSIINGQSEEEFKQTMKGRGIDLELLQQKSEELIQQNEDAVQRSENAITKFKREQHEERVALAEKEQAEKDRLAKEEADRLRREAEAQAEFDEMIRNRRLEADALFNERLLAEQEAQFEREFDLLEEQIDRENELKAQQEELETQKIAARQKLTEDLAQASIDLAQTVFTITNALGKQDEDSRLKRAKRQFEINKALSIADATISTINGVVNALSEKSILPAPLSTIARLSNAAAVAAAGIANIAKISAQKFDGGVASPVLGSGGDSSGGASTTPNITPIQAGSTFLNQEPQKVYVVESEITDTQNSVKATIAEATF